MIEHYDLLVIGSGPGGQRAAIQASKLGKRVAVVEKSDQLGGAALRAGTIPTKALREAALVLSGAAGTGLLADKRVIRRNVTINELTAVTRDVITTQLHILEDDFARNHIEVVWGQARFEDAHTVLVEGEDRVRTITADYVVIATGTRAAQPAHVPFNDRNIFTTDTFSDTFRNLQRLPRSILVVGGGVIGTELACTVAVLGVRVTLVESRNQLLGFIDREILEAFHTAIRRLGVTLRLGEKVQRVEEMAGARGDAWYGRGSSQEKSCVRKPFFMP